MNSISIIFFIIFFGITAFSDQKVTINKHLSSVSEEQCRNCHLAKKQDYILSKKTNKLKHAAIHSQHGRVEVACGSCHDRNNSNLLRTSEDSSATFVDSSAVCKQCHQDRYKDWSNGIHGKRLGGWNLQKKQFSCVECHQPHNVKFRKMSADRPPKRPPLGVKKEVE